MKFKFIILVIIGIGSIQFSSCIEIIKEMLYSESDNEYDNIDKFEKTIYQYHNDLVQKYGIKEFSFDVECIYSAQDLSRLVSDMLKIAEIEYTIVEEGHTPSTQSYFSIFEIADEEYKFTTTAESDYVDLENIQPHLDQIVKKLKPEFEFNYSNADGGQVAMMIFANSKKLREAVNEGFPCSLDENIWIWNNNEWKWGLYSDIKLKEIPDFDDLKLKFHKTTQALIAKGLSAPPLTMNRIYVTDLFDNNRIDVIIDGNIFQNTSNDINGNTVRCFSQNWNVLLAYVLVKEFDGQPSLYDKDDKTTLVLSQEEYLKKVEKALGKNN